MSDVTTRPQVATDRRVQIPRSRVRELLDRLGASMPRRTTRSGAEEFGKSSEHEKASQESVSTVIRQLCSEIGRLWSDADDIDRQMSGGPEKVSRYELLDRRRVALLRQIDVLADAVLHLHPADLRDAVCQSTIAASHADSIQGHLDALAMQDNMDPVTAKLTKLDVPNQPAANLAAGVAQTLNTLSDFLANATGLDRRNVGLASFMLVDEGGSASHSGHNSDAFADTIAAFEAEAPAPLCMPAVPSSSMLEAATATGISTEQVQAAYAAMVDAYRQERAA